MIEEIILVDEHDNQIGTEEKLKAHKEGKLHRCFSIFVFNDKGELLLQQRALEKYHSGGLWTNTCCSHPRPGEDTLDAAHRRLKDEMGFDCELTPAFDFTYQADLDHGIHEYEFDHVFVGKYDKDPVLNSEEAMAYKWVKLEQLQKDMQDKPEIYSAWLKICFERLLEYLDKN